MSVGDFDQLFHTASKTQIIELFNYIENLPSVLDQQNKALKSSDHSDVIENAQNLKTGKNHSIKSETLAGLNLRLEEMKMHFDFINPFPGSLLEVRMQRAKTC